MLNNNYDNNLHTALKKTLNVTVFVMLVDALILETCKSKMKKACGIFSFKFLVAGGSVRKQQLINTRFAS